MEADRSRKVGWQFWLAWMLASAAGFVAGMFLGMFVAWRWDTSELVSMAIFTILVGAGGGVGQWLVLQQHLPRTGWWVPATAVGFMLGGIAMQGLRQVASPLDEMTPQVTFIAVAGIATGTMQWLVLRQHVAKVGWWIGATIAGVSIGAVMAASITPSLEQSQRYVDLAIAAGTVLGAGFGAIPGTVLVWMLRQPGPRSAHGAAAAAEAA